MKLLLIEDDKILSDSLVDFLQRESYSVICADSIQSALKIKINNQFDLILLDWNLPDGKGIDLLKQWRDQKMNTKVIFLTARADILDRVMGLEFGAQDYILKPFDPRELLARIRAHTRSTSEQNYSQIIEIKKLKINTELREVYYDSNMVILTKKEYELLVFLVLHPNKPYSREELLNIVWGYENFPTTRTVDNHILQLRQKIQIDYFETVHGLGYRFKI